MSGQRFLLGRLAAKRDFASIPTETKLLVGSFVLQAVLLVGEITNGLLGQWAASCVLAILVVGTCIAYFAVVLRARMRPKTRSMIVVAFFGLLSMIFALYPRLAASQTPQPPPSAGIAVATITQTASPTTAIPEPTATTTSLSTPSPIPTSVADCDVAIPPCLYRVRQFDNFTKIAERVYGNGQFVSILMNQNRKDDGTYVDLTSGDHVYVPDADSPPPLSFPLCESRKTGMMRPRYLTALPCQYRAYEGDTYATLAQDFYSNPESVSRLVNSNLILGVLQVSHAYIPEGTTIVVPTER